MCVKEGCSPWDIVVYGNSPSRDVDKIKTVYENSPSTDVDKIKSAKKKIIDIKTGLKWSCEFSRCKILFRNYFKTSEEWKLFSIFIPLTIINKARKYNYDIVCMGPWLCGWRQTNATQRAFPTETRATLVDGGIRLWSPRHAIYVIEPIRSWISEHIVLSSDLFFFLVLIYLVHF